MVIRIIRSDGDEMTPVPGPVSRKFFFFFLNLF